MNAIDLFAGAGGFSTGAVRRVPGCLGFPEGYQLPEQHRAAVHMLGNAVCPPVARDVIGAVMDVI